MKHPSEYWYGVTVELCVLYIDMLQLAGWTG